jgi:glycosyltransferase involved in cell wall biosynthesis
VFVLPCITTCLGWREIARDPLLGLEVGLAIPFRPWMDGIPNVLLEAMAMEIPVISTHVAGIPELIESGRNGLLVPEKDPEGLARAIEELGQDPERRRRVARRGREVIRKRFDRERTIRGLVDIFTARKRLTVVSGSPSLPSWAPARDVPTLP